jgi:hypothetical protein
MNTKTQPTPEEVFEVFGCDAQEIAERELKGFCHAWLHKQRQIEELERIIPTLPVIENDISLRGLYEVMLPRTKQELYVIERRIKWLQSYFDLMHESGHFKPRVFRNHVDAKELKSRINIVDVVQRDVELKRSGKSMMGRCPFHNDRSPSFHVYEGSQRWWCFACNEGGDVYNFIQKSRNCDFRTALSVVQSL